MSPFASAHTGLVRSTVYRTFMNVSARAGKRLTGALLRLASLLRPHRPALAPPHAVPATAVAAQPPRHGGFRSTRADVRLWVVSMSPALRSALGDAAVDPFERILHRMRPLPDEAVVLDFISRVPDWPVLHPVFAGYLLKRMAFWHARGWRVDGSAVRDVAAWFAWRTRTMCQVDADWNAVVRTARHELHACSDPFRRNI